MTKAAPPVAHGQVAQGQSDDVLHQLLLPVGVLLIVFVAFERVQSAITRLPERFYADPPGYFDGIVPLLVLAALVISFVALWWLHGRQQRWTNFVCGQQLRWFVLLLAAAVSWPLVVMPFNFYFDQAYPLLRVGALLLLVGAFWRPFLLVPLTYILSLLLWQLDQPKFSAGFIFPHKVHLLHVLNLSAVLCLVSTVWRKNLVLPFLVLVFCLVAAVYWQPALAKWRINWWQYGNLEYMPIAAYAHGWLGHWDFSQVGRLVDAIKPVDPVLRFITLGFETLFLVVLWRRQLAMGLLACAAFFHMGVFILYGYLFWTWIVLNLALLALVWRIQSERRSREDSLSAEAGLMKGLFGFWPGVVSIALIGTSNYWCNPSQLAWFDTRVSYVFPHEVVGDSGLRYALSPRFFEPYGDVFTMASFRYLVDQHNSVTGPYATVGRLRVARQVNAIANLADLEALEKERPRRPLSLLRVERHEQFLSRYFQHWNETYEANPGDQMLGFGRGWSPPQFWSTVQNKDLPEFRGQETVREVTVRESTNLYDGTRFGEIRSLVVLRTEIPR